MRPADALEIVDVPEQRRYEARVGGEFAGWVDYHRVRDRLVALHTEVLPAFEGRGIGSKLVRRVIDDTRAAGGTITPRCPLFVRHFERHPEDADIVRMPAGGTL
ncbi:MAG TPA: GNAT family N-acetyltransferase [Candidatus Limnocylindrales bacterium]